MDFRVAQPIVNALKAKAEQGIFGYTSRPASYFEAVREWQLKRHGRNFCAEHIPQIKPNLPESAYLIWFDCRALGLFDADMASFAAKKAGLALNLGASFGLGGEGHLRLNAASPRSVLRKAMEQLRDAVNNG